MNTTYVLLALCWGISTVNLALALRLAIPHHPTTGPTRSPLRRSRPTTSGRDVSGARSSRTPTPGGVSAGESLASPGTTRPLAVSRRSADGWRPFFSSTRATERNRR